MIKYLIRIGNDRCIFILIQIASFFHLKKVLGAIFDNTLSMVAEKKYRGIDEFVFRVENIQVIFAIDDLYSKKWFYLGYRDGKVYERSATKLLINNLKKGMCFIDVGAHIGDYSIIASKVVGDQGRVYAFEIDEFNYSLLDKNVKINKINNVETHHMGISDKKGKIKYIRVSASGNPLNHLVFNNEKLKDKDVVSVDCISLDEFCSKENIKPDVIKIDVEGAELKVINGMEKLLRNPNVKIFCEIHPYQLTCFGNTVNQILDKLTALGLDIFKIQNIGANGPEIKLRPLGKGISDLSNNTIIYAYHNNNN